MRILDLSDITIEENYFMINASDKIKICKYNGLTLISIPNGYKVKIYTNREDTVLARNHRTMTNIHEFLLNLKKMKYNNGFYTIEHPCMFWMCKFPKKIKYSKIPLMKKIYGYVCDSFIDSAFHKPTIVKKNSNIDEKYKRGAIIYK